MKNSIFKGKSARTRLFAAISVLAVLLIFGLNLLLTAVGLKSTAYLDLTPEGLYSLTDRMLEECDFINELPEDKEIRITFCADPDTLTSSTVMRATYFMALNLQKEYDNVTVETVNAALNPTALARYKTTSLSTISASDVIISFGDRYRIASANSFWGLDSSGALWSYNGEYRLASILLSLTSRTQPVAYFITGHGESYYDVDDPESEMSVKNAYFADLLSERGLYIKTLDLSADGVTKIPDDAALLIINNPTRDFTFDDTQIDSLKYVSELEMIDNYLVKGNGSLMVSLNYDLRDYEGYEDAVANGTLDSFNPLKSLKIFLAEWGFSFSDTQVKDKGNSYDSEGENIIGVYSTDTDSYGNAIYGNYASSASAPKMVVTNTGYVECSFGLSTSIQEQGSSETKRQYDSFISTSASAIGYAYNESKDDYSYTATDPGTKALAAVVARQRLDPVETVYTYSYVFCANSKDFFSNDLLGNPAYANYDVISAVVENMVRTDVYASSDLGGSSMNSKSFGGKQLVSSTIYDYENKVYSPDATEVVKINKGITPLAITVFSIFIYAVPTVIAIVGISVGIKRKFL